MTSGLFWSMVATVCGIMGTLLVTPPLVHTLGPPQFGVYLLVLALGGYAGFLDLGLTWAAGRYFATDLADGRHIDLVARFHTLAAFLAGVGGVSMAVAVLAGRPLLRWAGAQVDANTVLALGLGGAAFAFGLQTGLSGSLLRAGQRFAVAGRMQALGAALLPIAVFLAVSVSGTLVTALLAVVLANTITAGASVACARAMLGPASARPCWRPDLLREMFAFGGWASVSRIVMVIMLQFDRMIVALIGSPTAVMYYAVPATLASRVNTMGGPLASLFFSRASLLHASRQSDELAVEHARATRFLVWTATAAAVPLLVLGDVFLRVWIGHDMAVAGSPVLVALGLGYAAVAVASLDGVTLEAAGRADLTAKTMGAWALVATAGVAVSAKGLGPLAVALGVGGWLAAISMTNMVLARCLVLRGRSTGASRWLLGVGAAGAIGGLAGTLMRPAVDSLPVALFALAVAGGITIFAGFFTVLAREDRGFLAGKLRLSLPLSTVVPRIQEP